MARQFRDWVRSSLWASPVAINANDSAYIKLGLGWRSRDRADGGKINGKAECIEFLNAVVRDLEDEICAELRKLNRAAVVDFALLNHESAIVERDQWQNTASAVLALHHDRAATLE